MTRRVSIRPPKWVEMSFVRWLWSDENTMAPVGGPVLLDDEQAERWFERLVDPGNPRDSYNVIVDHQGRLVGEASWHRLDPYTMTAELNIKVVHSERRQGYAQQALEHLLRDFFCERGGKLIIDDVAPDNLVGQQMLLRFGFLRYEGVDDVYRLLMTQDQFRSRYGCTDRAASDVPDQGGAW